MLSFPHHNTVTSTYICGLKGACAGLHGNPGARLSELLVKITISNYPRVWPSGAIGAIITNQILQLVSYVIARHLSCTPQRELITFFSISGGLEIRCLMIQVQHRS